MSLLRVFSSDIRDCLNDRRDERVNERQIDALLREKSDLRRPEQSTRHELVSFVLLLEKHERSCGYHA
jgi:hypothetical protein